MQYQLFRSGPESTDPIFSLHFNNDHSAVEYCRTWLEENAEYDRYILQREDNSRSTLMIRTVAGQWYAMLVADPDNRAIDSHQTMSIQ